MNRFRSRDDDDDGGGARGRFFRVERDSEPPVFLSHFSSPDLLIFLILNPAFTGRVMPPYAIHRNWRSSNSGSITVPRRWSSLRRSRRVVVDDSDYLRRARVAALASGQMTLVESSDEMNTVAIIIHDDTTQVSSFERNESIEVADFRSPFTSREIMNAATPTQQQDVDDDDDDDDDDSMTRTTVCECTDTEFVDSDEKSIDDEESGGVEIIIQDSIIHRTPSFDHLIDHNDSSTGAVVVPVERSIDCVIKQPRNLLLLTPLRFIRRK